jgi:hypothetical protein
VEFEVYRSGFIFSYGVFQGDMHHAAPLPQTHQSLVDGDARDPGSKPGAPLELLQIAMRFEQRFLLSVFGILLVSGDSKGKSKRPLLAVLERLGAHYSFPFLPKPCGAYAVHNSPRLRGLYKLNS